MECGVRSVKCGVRSVKCSVRSVKCGVEPYPSSGITRATSNVEFCLFLKKMTLFWLLGSTFPQTPYPVRKIMEPHANKQRTCVLFVRPDPPPPKMQHQPQSQSQVRILNQTIHVNATTKTPKSLTWIFLLDCQNSSPGNRLIRSTLKPTQQKLKENMRFGLFLSI